MRLDGEAEAEEEGMSHNRRRTLEAHWRTLCCAADMELEKEPANHIVNCTLTRAVLKVLVHS